MKISLIIPIKNEKKRLQKMLPSLFSQTFIDYELILVDDPGTNDGTGDYVHSLQLQQPNKITYCLHEQGLRPSAKRNFGAKLAKGDYIYHLDADMYFPQVTLLQTIITTIENAGAQLALIPEICDTSIRIARVKNLEKLIISNDIALQQVRIFDRKLFWELGGYREDILVGAQQTLSDVSLSSGYTYVIPQVQVEHYEYSSSLWGHLKKKFIYGSCLGDYASVIKHQKKKKVTYQHLFFNRFTYVTSPLFWKSPLLGTQVLLLKFLEFFAVGLGYIYYNRITHQKPTQFR